MDADPYTGWVGLVVPVALREAASVRVAQLTGREEDARPDYFPVPLCSKDDPHGTITHYMASPRARESIIQNLNAEAARWPDGCHVIMLRHDKLPREWRVNVTLWLRGIGLMVWTPEEEEP